MTQQSHKLLYTIGFVSLISGIETLGQSSIKYANVHQLPVVAVIGMVCYMLISYILYRSFSYENMAIVNAWWNIITSVTVTLSGIFIFGETLKNTQLIGICLMLLGAGFLSAYDLGIL